MNDNPSLPEEEPADIDDGSETADATYPHARVMGMLPLSALLLASAAGLGELRHARHAGGAVLAGVSWHPAPLRPAARGLRRDHPGGRQHGIAGKQDDVEYKFGSLTLVAKLGWCRSTPGSGADVVARYGHASVK